ncbi:MAG: M43 family zinc metalloprotease [Chitinophagaceae bacterium]
MKNHLLILTALCLLVVETTFSQAICGFDVMHQRSMRDDPSYRNSVLANELKVQKYINEHKSALSRMSLMNGVLFNIPVVVHVVHTGGAIGTTYNPSDAQITGAISYLNQVYNGTYPGTVGVGDIQIQFVLAARDPNCNASTGIDRIDGSSLTNYAASGVNNSGSAGVSEIALKNFVRWDASAYYNIWVVNKIDGKDGTAGQFVAGYAYYAEATNHLLDGTIMLATQMATGLKTLPHEIGHALDLLHTFEGSGDVAVCPVNTDCTKDGDKVCDTDPVSENVSGGIFDFTCRTGLNSCTSGAYSFNTEHNYMAYTNCYTLFTAGQKTRMLAAMSLPNRASLVSSWALPGAYPVASFAGAVTASHTPVTNAIGLGGNYTGIMSVTINNKTLSSDATADDGGYINKADKCEFLIPLVKNTTYNFSATVLAQNNEQIRAWIDYNNDGIFNNASEQIYYNTSIPATTPKSAVTVSGSFTVPNTVTISTVLRLRVIDEVTGFSLSGGNYDPTYGQAEDYPVFVSASVLPVKTEYFKGVRKDDDAVLSWKTSFEQNAKEFAIEKSTDGVSYSNIGVVPATNITNGSMYSFTDKNITAPINYYRLRQIDADLKSELSQVVLVRYAEESGVKLKVINNPFTDQLNIMFNGIPAANSMVSLFDITGRSIFSKNYKVGNGQVINIDLSGFGLTPGTYILQTQTGNTVITKKIIKQ